MSPREKLIGEVLAKVTDVSRRGFLETLLASSALAAPVVASFALPGTAFAGQAPTTLLTTTTPPPTTTATPPPFTTTPTPTTTATPPPFTTTATPPPFTTTPPPTTTATPPPFTTTPPPTTTATPPPPPPTTTLAPTTPPPTTPPPTTPPSASVVYAQADTFIRRASANTNEGANPRLLVSARPACRGLVQFDRLTLVDLVTNRGIARAQLMLTIATNHNTWGQSDRFGVTAYPLNKEFVEGNGMQAVLPGSVAQRGTGAGATWNSPADPNVFDGRLSGHAPRWHGGSFDAATAPRVVHVNQMTGPVLFDVTADIQAGAYGWLLTIDPERDADDDDADDDFDRHRTRRRLGDERFRGAVEVLLARGGGRRRGSVARATTRHHLRLVPQRGRRTSVSRQRPEISVVLTGAVDEASLASCLAGFARQTLQSSRFELVVAGPPVPPRLLSQTPSLHVRHASGDPATIAEARNLALSCARAPVVLFWDGRWWPEPETLAYCRRFHERHPSDAETVRLHAVPHVSLRDVPVVRWRLQRGTFLPQPPADGVYAWPHFRCPGLSCRRALFELATFDPAYGALEDLHLGGRLAERSALTVWYERFPLAVAGGGHSFARACVREYLEGYFRQVRLREPGAGRALEDLEERFVRPAQYDRPEAELAVLRATVGQLEASLAGVDLSFPEPGRPRSDQAAVRPVRHGGSVGRGQGVARRGSGQAPASDARTVGRLAAGRPAPAGGRLRCRASSSWRAVATGVSSPAAARACSTTSPLLTKSARVSRRAGSSRRGRPNAACTAAITSSAVARPLQSSSSSAAVALS